MNYIINRKFRLKYKFVKILQIQKKDRIINADPAKMTRIRPGPDSQHYTGLYKLMDTGGRQVLNCNVYVSGTR